MDDDIGERILQSLGTPMLPALEKGGITREVLVEQLKAELAATETKVFNNNGKLIYSEPLISWEIRQRARMDCQKLLAVYPPEKYQLQLPPLSNLSDEELEKRINELEEARKVESVKGLDVIDYHPPESERTKDSNE
jgi:hypothetical protein